ncbi:MAG: peptidase S58 family protein [Dehalococcoidia bacterium]|nr:MAG: peptidase S58 family protein [Dehalococcoidia bacterium]
MHNSITDVPGIKVGHYTNKEAATGCTVILCEEGAVAGVDVRGSAPGTRETDPLRPMSLVGQAHAILLSGGSAFGLDAAGGVMRYLEERGYGFDVGVAKVPIVPAAILFDLRLGSSKVRPGPEEGYQACLAATNGPVAEGSVGAGTGATVGKILGPERMTKSGLGTASQRLGNITIGAIVAVNAFGDVVDPESGEVIAGPRNIEHGGFFRTIDIMKRIKESKSPIPTNTTIGVVATDALLNKEQVNKVAQMAHDGLARAIRPAHTMVDGDAIFVLSTGKGGEGEDVTIIGSIAAEVVATAIVRAVRQAEGLVGIPAAGEVREDG